MLQSSMYVTKSPKLHSKNHICTRLSFVARVAKWAAEASLQHVGFATSFESVSLKVQRRRQENTTTMYVMSEAKSAGRGVLCRQVCTKLLSNAWHPCCLSSYISASKMFFQFSPSTKWDAKTWKPSRSPAQPPGMEN